ncbi:MAG: hypothetical protein JXR70_10475, partial [Spirochaetales bacterium]|nr:hypothetical protein [Spirochaetales bacterium]
IFRSSLGVFNCFIRDLNKKMMKIGAESGFDSILRSESKEKNDEIIFKITKQDKFKEFKLTKSEFLNIIHKLQEYQTSDDIILYNSNYYEILVREESRFSFGLRHKNEPLIQNDHDNGIKYELSSPSNEYLIFLLNKINEINSDKKFLKIYTPVNFFWVKIEELGENADIFDVVKMHLFRYPTLKIYSNNNLNFEQLKKHSMSFIFNLSYNSEYTIVPQRYIDDIFRFRNPRTKKRCPLNEIDSPRRFYSTDLIYHYQMALSSNNPFLEYISFFHVAEHFFESVFSDELILKIKNDLTSPGFSYRRKRDINGLIKSISKAIQFRNEKMIFNENEALKLTLMKFVKLSEIQISLNDYEPTLINYYKTTLVPFSNGSRINFEEHEENRIYKSIADRIYKTRNALVHSKDGDKSRYKPFFDDKDLLPEIPLVRFIAEMIIIGSSKLIE